jgi:hypothetical protein
MNKQTQNRLEDSKNQGKIANRQLVVKYDELGNAWDIFVLLQNAYFNTLEEIGHIQDDTKVIADRFIVVPIFLVAIIDYVFFHAPVDHFLQFLVLSTTVKLIITIGILLLYIAIEVKACYTIYHAWQDSEHDIYNTGAKVQKWLFSIGGFIFACIPAGLFYYVMKAASDDIPRLFTIFLCLMSIIIHLFIVFGGERVIRSNDRFFGGMRIASKDRKRRKGFVQVKRASGKAINCTQHFDNNLKSYLADGGKVEYFPQMLESELASTIYLFIERGYYAEHPAKLPLPYPRLFGYSKHFGGYGNNNKLAP